MRRSVIIAAALAATGHTVSAQGMLLRIQPAQGQVTHYQAVVETYMQGGPMAQMMTDTTQPFMRMHLWQTTTVTAESGAQHTLDQLVDSARVESPAMPQLSAMMSQTGEMMKGATTTMDLTNRGKVTALDVKLPPSLQSMMSAQGGNTMGMGGGASGNLSSFLLLPERPVQVGGTWRDSMTVNLDSAGTAGGKASFAATFTLERMEGRVAVIGIDGTLSMSGGSMPAPSSFGMTGETKLDLDAGRATVMTTEMRGTVASPMGEIPMRMTMKMTMQ